MSEQDHTDTTHVWIEKSIVWATECFEQSIKEEDIVSTLQKESVSADNIFLIIQAARQLHKDRATAPPKKIIFRRV